jgi:hypothetical protein
LMNLSYNIVPITEPMFYVYKDNDDPGNHFTPSGFMGDIGDISIDEAYSQNTHSGQTCIQIRYEANGLGPQACDGLMPCRWAGIYWQEPPNNWGKDEIWKDRGFNLSYYKQLKFWARADSDSQAIFKVGGIIGPYGDSLTYPLETFAPITPQWQEFSIDISDADLHHIIGGFVWVSNWDLALEPTTIYLDDIRFEIESSYQTATLEVP